MSERVHKRKRSLQDTPVDLSKMRMALNRVAVLREELEGIEEMEGEMEAVMNHLTALEDILSGANKTKINFSTISMSELDMLGVEHGSLIINAAALTNLARSQLPKIETEINLLIERLAEIYDCVNMDYESSARMLLDAILLCMRKTGKIMSDSPLEIAILPGLTLASADGVPITNQKNGYELHLTGSVNYAVVQYDNVKDHKERLLSPGGLREPKTIFRLAKGHLFLVEAKRQTSDRGSLASFIPEAVSQALVFAKTANVSEVRFCISNGEIWIFLILKLVDNTWVYYDSTPRYVDRQLLGVDKICELVLLVSQWLQSPSPDLYTLDD